MILRLLIGVIVSMGIYIGYAQYKLWDANTELEYAQVREEAYKQYVTTIEGTLKTTTDSLHKLKADSDAKLKAVQESHTLELHKAVEVAKIRERIKDVSEDNDGSISPIIGSTFRWLQSMQAKGSSEDSGSTSEDSNRTH